MRRLSERNKVPVYYRLYDGTQDAQAGGLYTGENEPQYTDTAKERMVVGLNTGNSALEQFGIYDPFSVKITTDREDCPIDTSSILWLGFGDIEYFDETAVYETGSIVIKDGLIVRRTEGGDWEEVPHTHVVQRVRKSFAYISYLAKEVEVSISGE